jgi:hypothetical protein
MADKDSKFQKVLSVNTYNRRADGARGRNSAKGEEIRDKGLETGAVTMNAVNQLLPLLRELLFPLCVTSCTSCSKDTVFKETALPLLIQVLDFLCVPPRPLRLISP